MPRVTDAHRRARRDEIADAAVRVLRRNGVSSTSISQIVKESGLSAGAIYANFENKAELAQYIARSLLDWRVGEIDATTAEGAVRSPADVLRALFTSMEEEAASIALILQFWGEATIDPELHAVLTTTVTALREALERAIRPWAEARAGAQAGARASDADDATATAAAATTDAATADPDPDPDPATDALVRRTAVAMIVMSQGFLANSALFGWVGFGDYLGDVTAMLD